MQNIQHSTSPIRPSASQLNITPQNDNYESVDFYRTFFPEEEVNRASTSRDGHPHYTLTKQRQHLLHHFHSLYRSVAEFLTDTLQLDVPILFFLFLLGLAISVLSTGIDFIISLLLEGRDRLVVGALPTDTEPHQHQWYFLNYLLWIAFSLFMSVLAAACGQIISMHSSGSGIPEMKSVLSGVVMREYLSWRTFCGKILGLIATFAAGLSVGKEGPFVHISACVSELLMKIPIFKALRRNDFVRNQLLAAACSAGVAATFGSPFGGVLFSIEVTSTYYPVGNLWKGVFTSLIGTFFFFLFRLSGLTSKATKLALFSTQFDDIPDNIYEYVLFALLGVLCGIVGALFVWVFTKFVHIRQSFSLIRGSRYIPVLAVCFLTASLSFPLPLLKGSPQAVTQNLFSNKSISDEVPYLYLNLIISFSAKFLLTAMAIVLPLPCGLFTPIFVTGATLGRIFGELVTDLGMDTVPGGYAVVGAAALASASTGTLSTAIILFELTGQLKYMLPVLLATCCAVGVSNLFNLNIYDQILKMRGLPYLSLIDRREVQSKNMQHKTVQDIMRPCDDFYISMESNIRTIERVLRTTQQDVFPLVDREQSMLLIGSIQRGNLEKMLFAYKKDRAAKKAELELEQQSVSPGSGSELARRAVQPHDPSMARSDSFLGKIKFLIRSPSYYKEQKKKSQKKRDKTPAPELSTPHGTQLELDKELMHVEKQSKEKSSRSVSADADTNGGTETNADVHVKLPRGEASDEVVIEIEPEPEELTAKNTSLVAEDTLVQPEGNSSDLTHEDSFNVANVPILKEEDVSYSEDDVGDSPTDAPSSLRHRNGHTTSNTATGLQTYGTDMSNIHTRNRASSFGMERPRYMSDIRMINGEHRSRHQREQDASNNDQSAAGRNVNTGSPRSRSNFDFVVQIDPAPFQVSVLTPMAKIYFLFSMLGLSYAFVVSRGKLMGMVTRHDIIMKKMH